MVGQEVGVVGVGEAVSVFEGAGVGGEVEVVGDGFEVVRGTGGVFEEGDDCSVNDVMAGEEEGSKEGLIAKAEEVVGEVPANEGVGVTEPTNEETTV